MTTRISIDLEDELYKRLKVYCALEKVTIADVVRELLEKRFPKEEKKSKK
jgi:macrodomain Ter protein organizer (MatP/YcbG family)